VTTAGEVERDVAEAVEAVLEAIPIPVLPTIGKLLELLFDQNASAADRERAAERAALVVASKLALIEP
jgi:hypothetical protein